MVDSRLARDHRSPVPERSEHWSRYWGGGPLTSLPQDFQANYDGEIATFWSDCFRALPDTADILDACTGNGAVAWLAAQFAASHGCEFRITAVDAARIEPDLAVAKHASLAPLLSRIEFIGNTPLEEWARPAASLDLIVSQYGIEYCDQQRLAPHLAAMLKPRGALVMLCHAVSSDMLETMRREAADYALVDQARILRIIRSWLDGQLASESLRRRMGRAANRLAPEFRAGRSPLLGNVLALAQRVTASDERALRQNRNVLETTWQQLVSGRGRLEDMLRVNRLMADRRWYQPWLDAGLELERDGELLYRSRHRVGHYFMFRCNRELT